MPSERRVGVFFLITVVLAWGFTWPVNKLVLLSVAPIWSVALRSVIAVVVLFAIAVATRRLVRPVRGDVPVLISVTVLHMVGFTVLTSLGLQVVPAGRSVVLAYTTPLWVTPAAALVLGERLGARSLLGVAIGLVGLALLFNPVAFDWSDRRVVLGNASILAGALLWAGAILHIRAHRWRVSTFELLPWQMALSTVLLVAIALALEGVPSIEWTPSLAALLLYGGGPGTALAYWASANAGRRLPAFTMSLGLLATPVVSVSIATVWLREPLTLTLVSAIVLILGGIAIGTLAPARR
ncbi:MAG: DMT family transporter [Candidatus Rokubacteria bacterium]|nr:DMT family transporter [Candidatus Rokubacteria bacterium]